MLAEKVTIFLHCGHMITFVFFFLNKRTLPRQVKSWCYKERGHSAEQVQVETADRIKMGGGIEEREGFYFGLFAEARISSLSRILKTYISLFSGPPLGD